MPIRTASLARQLQKNGARLHLAMISHARSSPGADAKTSEPVRALIDERRALKEDQAKRKAQALLPKPKAVKLVKEVKPAKAPKAPKAAKEPKPAKKVAKGAKVSRADKTAKKAENADASARRDEPVGEPAADRAR